MTRRWRVRVLLVLGGLLLPGLPAGAQFFFPGFPPPVTSGPPIIQAPRKDIFILNGGSIAVLNGINQ